MIAPFCSCLWPLLLRVGVPRLWACPLYPGASATSNEGSLKTRVCGLFSAPLVFAGILCMFAAWSLEYIQLLGFSPGALLLRLS